MLRNAILAVCLMALIGFIVAALVDPGAWPATAMFAALAAAVAFERIRYQGKAQAEPKEPLSPTSERFIDPESGAQVQVWANARGERHYVEEPKPGS